MVLMTDGRRDVDKICDRLATGGNEWATDCAQQDDMTLVVLRAL
jgi:hypothetical protein